MKNYFSAIENRLQQLFNVINSENASRRYHLPPLETGFCALKITLDGEF
ncbi:hypothetical protein T12_9069 [Trichinella patagoniensis]|uniref:Uncharacterized protein n=1 Tax=Trichinella patagoniensis TaxID=990121 RepID=A0A0V0YUT2_9BILA|nr:hypothetical protein T12_9069 [Trichinella patagoniensis]